MSAPQTPEEIAAENERLKLALARIKDMTHAARMGLGRGKFDTVEDVEDSFYDLFERLEGEAESHAKVQVARLREAERLVSRLVALLGDRHKVFPEFPTVVTLSGSTRFREAFEKTMREETLAGRIVISVGLFGHLEGLDMQGETKRMLDELHLRKIDLADEVLVINVGGYIGESTRKEIEYAQKLGKRVRYLSAEKQQP